MGLDKKTKNAVKNDIQKIIDTVNLDEINKILDISNESNESFKITKTSLKNIAEWALNGKSQQEIASNLELSATEWAYLIRNCPAVMMIMERSAAYADLAIAGTLMQVALGRYKIKKQIPLKVKIYENGKVVGEDYIMKEVEEEQPPNFYALKYISEHKLSEKLGDKIVNDSDKFREIVDSIPDDDLEMIGSDK